MRLVDIDDIRVMKFLSEEDDPSESDGEREYRNGWNDALTAINDIQPSAEPRKGKWMECDHEKWSGETFAYRCSECGGAYHLSIEQIIGIWNFCPNCGADMRGEND